MRILIAEDEVEIARALKVLLEKNKSCRTGGEKIFKLSF